MANTGTTTVTSYYSTTATTKTITTRPPPPLKDRKAGSLEAGQKAAPLWTGNTGTLLRITAHCTTAGAANPAGALAPRTTLTQYLFTLNVRKPCCIMLLYTTLLREQWHYLADACLLVSSVSIGTDIIILICWQLRVPSPLR